MQRKKDILFDLDGTLTDPKEGITKSVRHALGYFGITVENLDSLLPFIGPPLKQSFEKFYGFSSEDADRAVSCYREYYAVQGIFENGVYEGIPSLLAALKQAGKRIFLATSKPTVYARQILEHFGILAYFDGVCGSELSGERVDKAEVIRYAMESHSISPEVAVMVGDRHFDIDGGKALDVATIGVLFGYGSAEEIAAAKPDGIARTVEDLKMMLMP